MIIFCPWRKNKATMECSSRNYSNVRLDGEKSRKKFSISLHLARKAWSLWRSSLHTTPMRGCALGTSHLHTVLNYQLSIKLNARAAFRSDFRRVSRNKWKTDLPTYLLWSKKVSFQFFKIFCFLYIFAFAISAWH